MPGIKITLPMTFSDPDDELPTLYADAILAPGSLVLIDFNHSASDLAAGVPATGAVIPNLAWEQAAAAHGSGSETDWGMIYTETMVKTAGADGTVERTGKGGLHVIMSQATSQANRGVYIGSGASGATPLISQYLRTNWNHAYYFSQWQRITRVGLAPGGDVIYPNDFTIHNRAVNPNINHFLLRGDKVASYGTGLEQRNDPALPEGLGNVYRSLAVTGGTGTTPAAAGDVMAALASIGQLPANFGAIGVNKSRSAVIYRAYLEDLTVSGRTVAEVDAIDHALWQAAFGTGGRFADDTFTAASSYA